MRASVCWFGILSIAFMQPAFTQSPESKYNWTSPTGKEIEIDLWTAFKAPAMDDEPSKCVVDVLMDHKEYGPVTFGLYSEPPRNVLSKRVVLMLDAQVIAMPPHMHGKLIQYDVQLPSGNNHAITALVQISEEFLSFLSPEIPQEMYSASNHGSQMIIDLGRITGSGIIQVPLVGYDEAIQKWNACAEGL